ncbi:MAG: transcription termination/antitermination protein NusA [Chloroflexi bacterium]|jgi:N utilization substance protein A|nr:transcription termination/antitermination protein NusA [Chloroflexota bacterium]
MKNEIILAFNEVLEDKGLPKEVIYHALESAMVSAYRKSVNASSAQQVVAKIDLDKGEFRIFAEKEVVDDVQDDRTEVLLKVAKEYDPNAELSDMVLVESTPENFGRVAAQTARQVIQQKIREAERQMQLDYYAKQIGEIISGVVQATGSHGLTIGLEMKAEGTMPRKEMIPFERFRIHDRIRALVAEVKDSPRGPQIILSRTHRDFLRRLLENEVPEIFHGIVEIRSIAREPGQRAKVAVSATQQGIDPVGACVGQRGVRIQAIVRELHDEKIDVIEWNKDPRIYIAKALSPARVNGVYLNETNRDAKTALVVVPEDQLSLAIGRDGQNARLAARLTSWRIDIKSLAEAVSDWLFALKNDKELSEKADLYQEEISKAEEIMARKTEGRILNMDDYDTLAKFVDMVENDLYAERQEVLVAQEKAIQEVLQTIPKVAFDVPLTDELLPESLLAILSDGGIINLGELALKYKTNSDAILSLPGIGPKTLEKIEEMVNNLADFLPAQAEPEVIEQEPAMEIAEESEPPAQVEPEVTEEIEEEAIVQPAVEAEALVEEEKQPENKEEAGQELSFEEMFKLETQKISEKSFEEEDEEEDSDKDGKKKKKRKYQEIEYDPDLDLTLVKKKHKRGDEEWGWEEE